VLSVGFAASVPGASPLVIVSLCNASAVPVVTFLAQLFLPECLGKLGQLERRMFATTFKLPFTYACIIDARFLPYALVVACCRSLLA